MFTAKPFQKLMLATTMLAGLAQAQSLESVILIGKVPGRYLTGKAKTQSFLSKVIIDKGVIKEVTPITKANIESIKSESTKPVLVLGDAAKNKFDVIYPGLFNLHNHTKQNMLPVWGEAHGQFANRFEWRDWSHYTEAVSQNMNPWIKDYGSVVECAAFRWSELEAMVLGTTYLQGPSSCVTNFGIHHVEGGDGFLTDKTDAQGNVVIPKLNVQAPTDVVDPDSFTFIWDQVKPNVDKGDSFSKALSKVVFKNCPDLKEKIETAFAKDTETLTKKRDDAKAALAKKNDAKNISALEIAEYELKRELMMDKEVLKIVTDKPLLEKSCAKDLHPKFLRYMSFYHPTIAGKIYYINHPRKAAIIAHLSEGRRIDPYNQLEFELLKIVGLDQKNVNLIHAVGIDKAGLTHMAKKGMGLIWSPFSNFLLYGQTADIMAAEKAGVMMALGSDWTPTGSKSVLEELKIARNYVKQEKLDKTFTDEYLYKMVTENSAQMINQLENKAGDGVHGAGKVVADAVGTLIVVKENNADPHTNLVLAESKDINLVIITGKPTYGNVNYLKAFNKDVAYEVLPSYYEGLNQLVEKDASGVVTGVSDLLPRPKSESEDLSALLIKIASSDFLKELEAVDHCGFPDKKGFVYQDSLKDNSDSKKTIATENLVLFEKKTGLNLDRAGDIEKLLGSLLLSQGKNLNNQGNIAASISYFPSLFSCNDTIYTKRFNNFMADTKTKKDEYKSNMAYRIEFRKNAQDAIDEFNKKHTENPRFSNPEKMAHDYSLDYDTVKGVNGY